jgi:hypothetical protein
MNIIPKSRYGLNRYGFLSVLILLAGCTLFSQEYFQIRNRETGRIKKFRLDEIEYTVVTSNTTFPDDPIVGYNDSTLWIFRYRIEGHIGIPDSVGVALSDVKLIQKRLVADRQIIISAFTLLVMGSVGAVVAGFQEPGALVIFAPVIAGSAGILFAGTRERTFDMNDHWIFVKGVRGRKR